VVRLDELKNTGVRVRRPKRQKTMRRGDVRSSRTCKMMNRSVYQSKFHWEDAVILGKRTRGAVEKSEPQMRGDRMLGGADRTLSAIAFGISFKKNEGVQIECRSD